MHSPNIRLFSAHNSFRQWKALLSVCIFLCFINENDRQGPGQWMASTDKHGRSTSERNCSPGTDCKCFVVCAAKSSVKKWLCYAFFFLCIIFQTNKWDAIMNQSGLSDSIARPLCALILIKHSRIIMPDSVANWILMKPEFDISFLSVVSLCYDRKSGYRQGMLYVASIGAFWYLRWLIFNVFCSCATPVHVLSGLIPPCQVLAMVLVFWRWKCFKCLFYDG